MLYFVLDNKVVLVGVGLSNGGVYFVILSLLFEES